MGGHLGEQCSGRGCGTRALGGIYLEVELAPIATGITVEHFLIDPPLPVDPRLRIRPRGVHPRQDARGTWHVYDWIGAEHYPNVADFVEEARHLGISRRASALTDFGKLSRDSLLLLIHPKAIIRNVDAYYAAERDLRIKGHKLFCPKRPNMVAEHLPAWHPDPDETCARLWWQDLVEGEPIPRNPAPAIYGPPFHSSREVIRATPAAHYRGYSAPEGVRPEYEPGVFAAFRLTSLTVINDPASGSHERALERLKEAGAALRVTVRNA